jgi:hypothetical protein
MVLNVSPKAISHIDTVCYSNAVQLVEHRSTKVPLPQGDPADDDDYDGRLSQTNAPCRAEAEEPLLWEAPNCPLACHQLVTPQHDAICAASTPANSANTEHMVASSCSLGGAK